MFETLWELLSGRRHRNKVPEQQLQAAALPTRPVLPPPPRPPPIKPQIVPPSPVLNVVPTLSKAKTTPALQLNHHGGSANMFKSNSTFLSRRHSTATVLGVPGGSGGPSLSNSRRRRRGPPSGDDAVGIQHQRFSERRRQHK